MAEKATKLSGVKILLCVSGGIAAYKAIELAGQLVCAGAKVKTVMTANARRFVGPKSFEAVTGSAVYTSLWQAPEQYKIGHIGLADWAQIVVVAPATANITGKAANGICDDLLSTILCVCWQKPVLFAPAMNEKMWANPAVQRNVKSLQAAGVELVGPEKGRLASGAKGMGRMAEPEVILEAIDKIASKIKRRKKHF